jgi:hypothetical protein
VALSIPCPFWAAGMHSPEPVTWLPDQSDGIDSCALGGWRSCAAPKGARSAPLDLIEEHLTFTPQPGDYQQGVCAGELVKNWFFPVGFKPSVDGSAFVMKVQPFKGGGYEASMRLLNLEKIGRAIEFGGQHGPREKPDELDPVNLAKAAARAKTRMRLLVKNMAASHLCTLTRRETQETGYWSPEQWAKAWDRLRRVLVKAIGEFPYVAILEQHKKGNYHLHIAWCGRINLNLIRPAWWSVCGGRGSGNVDAQYIKVRQGGDRSARIARYISKYVSKGFEETRDERFNKKRYWASRQTLEEARRYVMNSEQFEGASEELRAFLGLEWGRYLEIGKGGEARHPHLFLFPGGDGLWLSFIPELHSPPCPF